MNARTFTRIEMPDYGVMRVNLVGNEHFPESVVSRRTLMDRIEGEGWARIMLDYRQCTLMYTVSELESHLQFYIENLPQHIRLAFIYGPNTLVALARASRVLNEAGLNVMAFREDQEALAFLTEDDWTRSAYG